MAACQRRKTTRFWAFYASVVSHSLKIFLDTIWRIEGLIAVLAFVVLFFNKEAGKWLMSWWEGISPYWAALALAVWFVAGVMRANHGRFVAIEKERNDALDGIDTTGNLRKLKQLKAEGKSIKASVPKYPVDEPAIPDWKGKLSRWQSDVLIEIEDHKLAEAFENLPEPSDEQKQQCGASVFTEMKSCLICIDQQLLILDDVISDLEIGH